MKEKLDKTRQNRNKGGRPTKKEQIEIENKLRPYFDMNVSAIFTASQPGMPNRHTVERYFSIWSAELRDHYREDINERQIIAKQKLKIAFQRMIEKLETQLNKFENIVSIPWNKWQQKNYSFIKTEQWDKITEFKPDMQSEYMIKKLIETIAEIQDAMAANESAPTIYEESEEATIKHLKEQQNRLWNKNTKQQI